MLNETQRGVLRGMLAGILVTALGLAAAITYPPEIVLPGEGFAASLTDALKWSVLPVATLAIHIALLARHRYFTPEDFNGGGLSAGTPHARVLQAALQNTLEQTVLALSVYAIWAAAMPRRWQAAIALAAILFAIGRLLFLRGYGGGAPARAIGFALTFYPTLAMLIMLVIRLLMMAGRS